MDDAKIIDLFWARNEEAIQEAETFEIMNSYIRMELPKMKSVKDFPAN